jgi:small GTP-binding protein
MRAAKAANEGGGSSRGKKKLSRVKIVVIGDAFVGKSMLVQRWVEERYYGRYSQTVGVEHTVKRRLLGDFDVRVNIWELAGGESYFEIRNEFYKDAQGAVLCFDVGNLSSFEGLDIWINEMKEHGNGSLLPSLLVGTKSDQSQRKVSEAEARGWAESKGFLYAECSALTGQGVGVVWDMINARVLSTLPNTPPELVSHAMKAVPPQGPKATPPPHPPPLQRTPSATRESFRRGSLDVERDRDSSGSLVQIADEQELRRIERAANDWEVLKLDKSNTTLAQVKSTYRKMAVSVHPDKCPLPNAQAAFQKINSAYQNIVSKLG